MYPYIDEFSDKTFDKVSSLLLAHPSVLATYQMSLIYAARDLFKYDLFMNPFVHGQEYWDQAKKILIKAGEYIMIGEAERWSSKLEIEEIKWIESHRIETWSFVINDLWDAALRLKTVLEGPPELELKVDHLKDLLPYFGLSKRISSYMKNLTRVDYSNVVETGNKTLEAMVRPLPSRFSRIRHLESTVKTIL